jgi:cytochrome c peroxidase
MILLEGTKGDSLTMDKTTSNITRVAVALVAAAFCVAAEAGNHIADDQIAVARAAIEHAEQAGGPEAAPVEMASARDKLARAEKANARHDSKPATAWADQANIDAQVAEATATQMRSSKAATEFDASLRTLRQETNRASQSAQ